MSEVRQVSRPLLPVCCRLPHRLREQPPVGKASGGQHGSEPAAPPLTLEEPPSSSPSIFVHPPEDPPGTRFERRRKCRGRARTAPHRGLRRARDWSVPTPPDGPEEVTEPRRLETCNRRVCLNRAESNRRNRNVRWWRVVRA